jgi:D-arabinose 1-dehydrogenase-like Zn-dependent alcohol dehydrogenase
MGPGSRGARIYIDGESQDVAKELVGLGGARVILATASDGKSMGGLIDGLKTGGTLVVVGGRGFSRCPPCATP